MQTQSNEQLCIQAQKGDSYARELLLINNLGFIRKTANEIYQSMGLEDTDLVIDRDDLEQEGSLGLLKAIELFDAGKGMKFLTYAAPSIRNAMIDLVRSEYALFEQKLTDKKDGLIYQKLRLDELLPGEEKLQRMEAIANPDALQPEDYYLKKETIRELYETLDMLTPREQTYLLYRYGFTDDIEHPLIGTAIHFHLSESRAKKLETQALDNLWVELPWWF